MSDDATCPQEKESPRGGAMSSANHATPNAPPSPTPTLFLRLKAGGYWRIDVADAYRSWWASALKSAEAKGARPPAPLEEIGLLQACHWYCKEFFSGQIDCWETRMLPVGLHDESRYCEALPDNADPVQPLHVSELGKEKAKRHLKFGNMLARSGMLEKALDHYELARRANPLSASPHHNIASICQRLNRFVDAIPRYEAALRLKPTLVEAASNLAVAQLNAKRPSDAIASSRHAIQLQRDVDGSMNLEASHHLNVALRLVGRRDDAVQETWTHIEALAAAEKDSGSAKSMANGSSRPAPLAFPPPPPAANASTAAAGMSAAALTVVCVKWGDLYGADYVNKLSRACRRQLGPGGVSSFVCFTEDASGLDADVEVKPLPSKNAAWKGWWYKAHVFSATAGLRGRVLYLDLDTVIVGDMAALRTYDGPFLTLATEGFDAEEGYVDGLNTSAMLWDAGGEGGARLSVLHDALHAHVFACLMRWDHWCEMLVPGAHTLQRCFPGMFVDYRSHCRGANGPPADAAVVCFPRNPKPHEVQADWVTAHWT